MDGIRVLDGGPLTTVQDLGRYGYQRYGLPVSGALDPFALRIANLLAGNDEGAAGLEMTMAGPELLFLADTVVALTGAELRPRLDGRPVPTWEAFAVPRGATLACGPMRTGVRAYLAATGGIDVPVVLGSRSTYLRSRLGGVEGRPLRAGDVLPLAPARPVAIEARSIAPKRIPVIAGSQTLRVVLGPQDSAFTAEGVRRFLSAVFSITPQSDRMGYRLDGPRVPHKTTADIVSDGTPGGAVQITGDQTPIILLADRGTAGGYTKIAVVIAADLGRLAQSAPGNRISFEAVTVERAHRALRQQEAIIEQVRSSRPRVFRRRRFWTIVEGVRYEALGAFEEPEVAERRSRASSLTLTVDGETFRVEHEPAEAGSAADAQSAGGGQLASERSATPMSRKARAAAAAVAAAAGSVAPPPRDFPIVV